MSFQGGWGAASGALGYSRTALENRVYEKKGQQVSLSDALLLSDMSGTAYLAEFIATLSGGTFVRLPDVGQIGNDELLEKFQQLQVHLGELSGAFIVATADSVIDRKEKTKLDAIAAEIHKTLVELMAITYRIYCPQKGESDVY